MKEHEEYLAQNPAVANQTTLSLEDATTLANATGSTPAYWQSLNSANINFTYLHLIALMIAQHPG